MLTPLSAVLVLSLALRPGELTPQRSAAQGAAEQGLPTYYFLLGRYLEGEGKVDDAAAALRKAIDLDPTSAEPRAELAALYARADRPVEAVAAAEEAVKVDPRNREA